jgi:hypothetical protein
MRSTWRRLSTAMGIAQTSGGLGVTFVFTFGRDRVFRGRGQAVRRHGRQTAFFDFFTGLARFTRSG